MTASPLPALIRVLEALDEPSLRTAVTLAVPRAKVALPGAPISIAKLAFEAATLILNDGALDSELLNELLELQPRRRPEIEALARAAGIVFSASTPRQGRAVPVHVRIVCSLPDEFDCHGFGAALAREHRVAAKNLRLEPLDEPKCAAINFETDDIAMLTELGARGELDGLLRACGGYCLLEMFADGACIHETLPLVRFDEPKIESVASKLFASAVKPVKIAVITVDKIEMDALLSAMTPAVGHDVILRGVIGPLTYRVGRLGRYRIVHVECSMGRAGRRSSAITCRQILQDLKPAVVIMVGIAFGRDRAQQRLGDVLIAERCTPCGSASVAPADPRVSLHEALPCGVVLADRFRDETWIYRRSLGCVRPHYGMMVSADEWIDESARRDSLFRAHPDAIGGDVQGWGVYASCDDASCDGTQRAQAILVKGIAGWADGGHLERAQYFAAKTAASLVQHVLNAPGTMEYLGIKEDQALKAPRAPQRSARRIDPKPNVSKFKAIVVLHIDVTELLDPGMSELAEHFQALLRKAAQDDSICVVKATRGSLVLELNLTTAACVQLHELHAAGELSDLLGVTVLSLSSDASWLLESAAARQADAGVPNIFAKNRSHLEGTICRRKTIKGHEDAYERALAVLPANSEDTEECHIYIERTGNKLYAQSNVVFKGYDHSNKVCIEDEVELFYVYVNLVCSSTPSQAELVRLYEAHQTRVTYHIRARTFTRKTLDLQGAKQIRIVA